MSSLALSLLSPATLGAVALLLAVSVVGLFVQRLVFHPLARFPGPKLAAATWWYMVYYETFKDGAFVEQLRTLHARYGPVVRVGPNQLHFNTPSAYNDIYVQGHRFTKDPRVYQAFQQDECSLCLIDLKEAKTRREILAPLFSRRAILKLEHVIQSKVDKLVEELTRYAKTGKPANIRRACRSTALELIIAYCFASDEDFISAPDFSHKFVVESEMAFPLFFIMVHFPWTFPLLVLQSRIAAWFKPPQAGVLMDSYDRLREKIDQLVARPELVDKEDHETIFHHLLTPRPEKGQPAIPSTKALWEEAVNLIAAGSDSITGVMTFGVFYVLHNPAVHERLTAELRAAWPDLETTMCYEALEKLPYLTAVIKESLRFAQGVVVGSGRVVGPTDATIAGISVPAGAVVAMGPMFIHLNPDIFPDPHQFIPERWMGADKGKLDQYLVTFGRGSRACLGMNLGWCELYLLFGNLFRRFELDLYNTTIDDMAYRCHFTPSIKGTLYCNVKARND